MLKIWLDTLNKAAKYFLLLLLLFPAFCTVLHYNSAESRYCAPHKGQDYIEALIGKDRIHVPVKLVSLCLKAKESLWPSFILNISYPDWGPLPRMNKDNRNDIIKRTLSVTISDNLETRPDIKDVSYKYKIDEPEIIDGVKRAIYPDAPQKLPNGMIHYVSKAKRHENMRDLYILKDEKNHVVFMLECGPRVVGGGYCTADNLFLGDLNINYSYDISHLSDAIQIHKEIIDLVSSMRQGKQ